MSVSATSSASGFTAADLQSSFQKTQQDFRALGKALQSGDLASAQQAFAALQKDLPSQTQTANASTSSSDPLAKVGQALQSGDLTGAQQAFAALRGGHHGHHHHVKAAVPAASSTGSSDSDGKSGSVLNVSA